MIQWNISMEIKMLKHDVGRFKDLYLKLYFVSVKAEILERWIRFAAAVNTGVEIKFYICYGDVWYKHFVQSEDIRFMVDLVNDFVNQLFRYAGPQFQEYCRSTAQSQFQYRYSIGVSDDY